MNEKFGITPDMLRKREVRHDPMDDLYSLEGVVSLREKVAEAARHLPAEGDEARFLERVLEGPVAYLEMPDRYDLSDIRAQLNNEQFRMLREQGRKEDAAVHELLEKQRVRPNTIDAILLPLFFSQIKGLGDSRDRQLLQDRYETLAERLGAKEGYEEVDHRVMTDAQKDEIVKAFSLLAKDIVNFALATVGKKEE